MTLDILSVPSKAAPAQRAWVLAILVIVGGLIVGMSSPRGGRAIEDVHLRLDASTAPPQALMALPALGPVRVSAIDAERSKAPFRSVSDLERRVKGIGPVISRGLAPHLRFPDPDETP